MSTDSSAGAICKKYAQNLVPKAGLHQLLGVVARPGLRKCSQRVAFKGETPAALQRLLQSRFRRGLAKLPVGCFTSGKPKPHRVYVSMTCLSAFSVLLGHSVIAIALRQGLCSAQAGLRQGLLWQGLGCLKQGFGRDDGGCSIEKLRFEGDTLIF